VSQRIVLTAGSLELHLLPAVGGSIARFDRISGSDRQPLLRGVDKDDVGPLNVACFPLVPFANRIRGSAFEFAGKAVRLRPNMPPDPSPLHGQGWQQPWHVMSASGSAAELVFRHVAAEWPWSYEARQLFELDSAGLSITLVCRNLSEAPMPCALGLHPYYPCDAETVLNTVVETVWTVDGDVLPVEQIPAQGRYDLREKQICGQNLDNGYGGWNGIAEIVWPGQPARLRMRSQDANFFQVYSPASGGLFAAEPVQNANAALNAPTADWPALGIEVLEPGQERRLEVRYDVLSA
jgi:aldose 1-epimerase